MFEGGGMRCVTVGDNLIMGNGTVETVISHTPLLSQLTPFQPNTTRADVVEGSEKQQLLSRC